MSIGVGLFVFTFTVSVFAIDRVNFSTGRSYPNNVTLEMSLVNPAKVQYFGECHIHASIVAAEAACFRHTRQKFSLSPAYFFNRHLRTETDDLNNQPFLTMFRDGQFSQNDAGFYETTLKRIQTGNVMLETDYTMANLNNATSDAQKVRKQYWKLFFAKKHPNETEYENKMRSELAIRLDQSVEKAAGKVTGQPAQACEFEKLQFMNFNVTPERAVALITSGIPFICQAKLGGTSGQHVVLFAGYQYAPGYSDNLSFKVRDSRLSRLLDTGWAANCLQATVVFYPNERRTVLKSINL